MITFEQYQQAKELIEAYNKQQSEGFVNAIELDMYKGYFADKLGNIYNSKGKCINKIKYATFDNIDETKTLSQHIFKKRISKKPFSGEEYNGNISLCGKIKAVEDTEFDCDFDEINNESEKENCCKLCKRIKISICKKITN